MPSAPIRLWTVVLAPGEVLSPVPDCLRTGLILVEVGDLEVVCRRGGSARFGPGAMVTFAGLPAERVRNTGKESLTLRAMTLAPPVG
ncbi:MAG: hypothetical protein ACRDPG_07040 [Nocardioidaceae bacterium]